MIAPKFREGDIVRLIKYDFEGRKRTWGHNCNDLADIKKCVGSIGVFMGSGLLKGKDGEDFYRCGLVNTELTKNKKLDFWYYLESELELVAKEQKYITVKEVKVYKEEE